MAAQAHKAGHARVGFICSNEIPSAESPALSGGRRNGGFVLFKLRDRCLVLHLGLSVLENVKIESIAHHHRRRSSGKVSGNFPVVSKPKPHTLDPAFDHAREVERKPIEHQRGNAPSAGLVAGQSLFLKDDDSRSTLAQPVGRRSPSRSGTDDDDVVGHSGKKLGCPTACCGCEWRADVCTVRFDPGLFPKEETRSEAWFFTCSTEAASRSRSSDPA
jgi:hypothetical protein